MFALVNLNHVWCPRASARVLSMPVGLHCRLNGRDSVMIVFGLQLLGAGLGIQFVCAAGLRIGGRWRGWNWNWAVIMEAGTRLVMIYDSYNNFIIEVPLRRFTIRQYPSCNRMIEDNNEEAWTLVFCEASPSRMV